MTDFNYKDISHFLEGNEDGYDCIVDGSAVRYWRSNAEHAVHIANLDEIWANFDAPLAGIGEFYNAPD